ncbi:hypothetical protein EYF80_043815 [Liparis tanakae]|uniref:Uncharacterized protein n=1 Tax=Liparis tanakae TaxID=230148 RepID=A0A4Z2FXI9_9TELE|nr:hypothetical protein EYF80_043815 [Liparis tanakae]
MSDGKDQGLNIVAASREVSYVYPIPPKPYRVRPCLFSAYTTSMAVTVFLLACSVYVTASRITFSRNTLSTPRTGDPLHSAAASQTADGGLGDALDVITEDLPVALGASFPESFPAFASSAHRQLTYTHQWANEGNNDVTASSFKRPTLRVRLWVLDRVPGSGSGFWIRVQDPGFRVTVSSSQRGRKRFVLRAAIKLSMKERPGVLCSSWTRQTKVLQRNVGLQEARNMNLGNEPRFCNAVSKRLRLSQGEAPLFIHNHCRQYGAY